MSDNISVKVLDRSCSAGDAYAARQLGGRPKAAVVSCEGACLKGEIARRAANRIAHTLAPERAVRICHGGAFLLNQGGMRELVVRAPQILVLDGCSLACGTRLTRAAFPDRRVDTVVASELYEVDGAPFGVDELPDPEIERHAARTADQAVGRLGGGDAPETRPGPPEGCRACS